MMNDSSRIALITAGASGIGLVVAESLRQDGWKVIISDIDADKGLREAQRLRAEFRACDVSDFQQMQQLFSGLNHVDLLVNNAGIMGPSGFTWECPYDDWQETLTINLTSHFIACSLVFYFFFDFTLRKR